MGLILDGETVEEPFQHHGNDNDSLNMITISCKTYEVQCCGLF